MHQRETVNDHTACEEKEKETKDSAMFVQQYKDGRGKMKRKSGEKEICFSVFLCTSVSTCFYAELSWRTSQEISVSQSLGSLSLCEIPQIRNTSAGVGAAGSPQQRRTLQEPGHRHCWHCKGPFAFASGADLWKMNPHINSFKVWVSKWLNTCKFGLKDPEIQGESQVLGWDLLPACPQSSPCEPSPHKVHHTHLAASANSFLDEHGSVFLTWSIQPRYQTRVSVWIQVCLM